MEHPRKHTFQKKGIRSITPKKGEVWWVNYMPFDGNAHGKGRPVLITEVKGDIISYYRCTSQYSDLSFRYPIMDTLEAGLDKDTYVIMDSRTLHVTKLSRCIGRLTNGDMIGVGLRK